MAGDRTLKLSILADTKNLVDGLKKGEQSTATFGEKIAAAGKKAALALAAAGAAAVAFAAKAVLVGEQADTANKRIEQINKSMGLFGDSTSQVTGRLIEYAEATARATGVDTNAIKATQAKLLTFKELAATANQVGGEFDRATKAAIDLAAAGFGSAEQNAVQLGKALNDPIKGLTSLSRSGVTFTETEKERIKTLVESNKVGEAQKLILEAIETQVGGTAEATANASDKIRVGFTQVQEKIGIALLPAFEKLTNFILQKLFPAFEQKVLPVFQRINDFLQNKLVPLFERYVVPVIGAVKDAFDRVGQAIENNRGNFESVVTLFKTIVDFAQKYLIPILKTQLKAAIEGIGLAFKVILNIAGPVIGAVSNLITGIINLIDKAIKRINDLIAAYNRISFLPDIPLIGGGGDGGGGGGGKSTTRTITKSVSKTTCPSGKANYQQTVLNGRVINEIFVGCVIGSGTTTTTDEITGTTITTTDTTTTKTTVPKIATTPKIVTPSGNAIPANFDVAAVRRGEMEQPPIVINVNAPSAIDETGFTRAVQLAIQNTQQRGTGGGGFAQIL